MVADSRLVGFNKTYGCIECTDVWRLLIFSNRSKSLVGDRGQSVRGTPPGSRIAGLEHTRHGEVVTHKPTASRSGRRAFPFGSCCDQNTCVVVRVHVTCRIYTLVRTRLIKTNV